ncbi:MAG: ADP-dependent glucokinase/phosphofructokinase [Candidatus Asgardarchaeia archaeon]
MFDEKLKEIWDEKYITSVEKTEKGVSQLNGLFLGYNVNIDAIKYVDKELIETLEKNAKKDEVLKKDISKKNISSISDLLAGLIYCIENGIGEEWKIKHKEIYYWLKDNIDYDLFLIGGQAGIMANIASTLGVKRILLHAPVMNKTLALLLLNNVFVARKSNDIKLYTPFSVATGKDELIHWIFEFQKDSRFLVFDKEIVVPNSSRFIATFDPINTKLVTDEAFKEYIIQNINEFDGGILAGHHLIDLTLPKKYIEGKFKETKVFIKLIKEEKEKIVLKYELGVTSDELLIDLTKKEILPLVDVISLNEIELNIYALGSAKLSAVDIEARSKNILKGIINLGRITEGDIHLHTFDNAFYFKHRLKSSDKENEQDRILFSILFGSLVTSVRAKIGREPIMNEVKALTYSKESGFIFKKQSFQIMRVMEDYIKKSYPNAVGSLLYDGYIETDDFTLYGIPIKFVEFPKRSVGLGDTCSVSQLISYLANK